MKYILFTQNFHLELINLR